MKTEQNEKQFSKVLIFQITAEDDWEEDIGAWRHKAQQVYRRPQGDWTVVTGGTTRYIYFVPQLSGSADTDPNSLDLPEWVSCYWDPQAGRWIMMLSGGGQAFQFFRLSEDVTGTVAMAQKCEWDGSNPTGDSLEVRNWSALLNASVTGYVFLGGIEATSKEWVFVQGGCIGGSGSGSGSGISWSSWSEF
jgi:hypothetical protein